MPGRKKESIHGQEPPGDRPLRSQSSAQIRRLFSQALEAGDGRMGAHCLHEAWMRGELFMDIPAAQNLLWKRAAASIPDWLPMTYFERLRSLYEVAAWFAAKPGRSHIYLLLLD